MKARLVWSCDLATNDTTATVGCSAQLYNAKTEQRVGTLVETNTATQGTYLIPVSSAAVVYELHISTDNENFTVVYEVYQ